MKNIEQTILANLISNEQYARKVIPFLKPEYFQDNNEKIVFEEISKFAVKYSKLPTSISLQVELNSRKDLNEQTYKDITSLVETLQTDPVDDEWLTQTTERFCKDKAVYNAVVDGISSSSAKERFLAQVKRRASWEAECNGALQGMHGTKVTEAQVDAAFRDLEANGVDPTR